MGQGFNRFSLFVPMKLIELKYPGGVEQCKQNYERDLGKSAWFYEAFLELCVDTPYAVDVLVDEWSEQGFVPFADDPLRWNEMCVLPPFTLEPVLPCRWFRAFSDVSGERCVEVEDARLDLP